MWRPVWSTRGTSLGLFNVLWIASVSAPELQLTYYSHRDTHADTHTHAHTHSSMHTHTHETKLKEVETWWEDTLSL